MADWFFQVELQSEMFWPEAPPVNPSAFVRYTRPVEDFRLDNSVFVFNHRNMNKRMIEFLRASPISVNEDREPGNDPRYRHRILERLRRGKERQSYEALHSILPPRTKNDKNSIVQMATLQLQELKNLNAELQRRNKELEATLAENEREKPNMAKIRLRVVNSSSAMDSMVGVLQCLKGMNLKTRMIRSEFSDHEFSAVLEIDTQIEAAEVENALQNALMEVHKKSMLDFRQRHGS